MKRSLALLVLTGLVAVLPHAAFAQVPAAPFLQASVSGQTVSVSWSAVAGALSYRVEAGVSPNQVAYAQEVGPITSFSLPNVPQGTYYLRVFARNVFGLGAPSNVVGVSVNSNLGPPAAPVGLVVSVSGTSVTFGVQLPAGLTGLLLLAGTAPGTTQVVLPMSVSQQNTVNNVPPGVYYARMVAVNAGGPSPASNEVQVVVTAPLCNPPAAPTVAAQVAGTAVGLSWNAIGGAVGYRLDVSQSPGGPLIVSQTLPPSSTSISNPNVAPGTYYVKVVVANTCGQTAVSPELAVTVNAPPPGSNRTPNPPPGQQLPLPNRSNVVNQIAQQYPGDLQNSCVTAGGNNTWLFRLVQRLRQEDTRWGLNWKRGRIGDMSQDILTYNWGSEADEGTRQIYVLDVIGGHCGPTPSASWNNVTGQGGADAIWTLQPYTAAGFPR